ncbi:MAG: hypothetical protein ABI563_10870 [Specibacter sp.]
MWRENGFPATIVRPSSTYDHTNLPLLFGWTDVHRMREGLLWWSTATAPLRGR